MCIDVGSGRHTGPIEIRPSGARPSTRPPPARTILERARAEPNTVAACCRTRTLDATRRARCFPASNSSTSARSTPAAAQSSPRIPSTRRGSPYRPLTYRQCIRNQPKYSEYATLVPAGHICNQLVRDLHHARPPQHTATDAVPVPAPRVRLPYPTSRIRHRSTYIPCPHPAICAARQARARRLLPHSAHAAGSPPRPHPP